MSMENIEEKHKTPSLAGRKPTNKQTIFVVDDDPDLVTILRLILEHNGYQVVCVYSGRQLFTSLEDQKPDLIILDVMMPHMHGFEVLSRLKGIPATSSIPVIMVTAKIRFENILEGYKAGADYYIPKPFTKSQLLEGIHRILNEDDKDNAPAGSFQVSRP